MSNYKQQKMSGTTIFRAKSVKDAMADARMAFGTDAEIVSVEKVGKVYCVEIVPPTSSGSPPEDINGDILRLVMDTPVRKQAPHQDIKLIPTRANVSAAASAIKGKASGFDLAALESVERLEKSFQELASRLDQNRQGQTQAEGLAGMTSIRRNLEASGFSEPFVGKLTGAMIDAGAVHFTKELPMRIVASWLDQLGTASDMELGWHAVVGPAGSGKTTSIAKFASRTVAKWGADSVGLVTTDFFRIGAYEQLRVFGELLGVKVHSARSFQELQSLRVALAGKKVVFVDTVGSSRDDEKMREQMGMLTSLKIESTVALQACLARSVMRLDLGRWRDSGATSALVTKMDQATGVASMVEALIMRGLPVSYATNGQRVPADLHRVSSLLLAHKALRGDSAVA